MSETAQDQLEVQEELFREYQNDFLVHVKSLLLYQLASLHVIKKLEPGSEEFKQECARYRLDSALLKDLMDICGDKDRVEAGKKARNRFAHPDTYCSDGNKSNLFRYARLLDQITAPPGRTHSIYTDLVKHVTQEGFKPARREEKYYVFKEK